MCNAINRKMFASDNVKYIKKSDSYMYLMMAIDSVITHQDKTSMYN